MSASTPPLSRGTEAVVSVCRCLLDVCVRGRDGGCRRKLIDAGMEDLKVLSCVVHEESLHDRAGAVHVLYHTLKMCVSACNGSSSKSYEESVGSRSRGHRFSPYLKLEGPLSLEAFVHAAINCLWDVLCSPMNTPMIYVQFALLNRSPISVNMYEPYADESECNVSMESAINLRRRHAESSCDGAEASLSLLFRKCVTERSHHIAMYMRMPLHHNILAVLSNRSRIPAQFVDADICKDALDVYLSPLVMEAYPQKWKYLWKLILDEKSHPCPSSAFEVDYDAQLRVSNTRLQLRRLSEHSGIIRIRAVYELVALLGSHVSFSMLREQVIHPIHLSEDFWLEPKNALAKLPGYTPDHLQEAVLVRLYQLLQYKERSVKSGGSSGRGDNPVFVKRTWHNFVEQVASFFRNKLLNVERFVYGVPAPVTILDARSPTTTSHSRHLCPGFNNHSSVLSLMDICAQARVGDFFLHWFVAQLSPLIAHDAQFFVRDVERGNNSLLLALNRLYHAPPSMPTHTPSGASSSGLGPGRKVPALPNGDSPVPPVTPIDWEVDYAAQQHSWGSVFYRALQVFSSRMYMFRVPSPYDYNASAEPASDARTNEVGVAASKAPPHMSWWMDRQEEIRRLSPSSFAKWSARDRTTIGLVSMSASIMASTALFETIMHDYSRNDSDDNVPLHPHTATTKSPSGHTLSGKTFALPSSLVMELSVRCIERLSNRLTMTVNTAGSPASPQSAQASPVGTAVLDTISLISYMFPSVTPQIERLLFLYDTDPAQANLILEWANYRQMRYMRYNGQGYRFYHSIIPLITRIHFPLVSSPGTSRNRHQLYRSAENLLLKVLNSCEQMPWLARRHCSHGEAVERYSLIAMAKYLRVRGFHTFEDIVMLEDFFEKRIAHEHGVAYPEGMLQYFPSQVTSLFHKHREGTHMLPQLHHSDVERARRHHMLGSIFDTREIHSYTQEILNGNITVTTEMETEMINRFSWYFGIEEKIDVALDSSQDVTEAVYQYRNGASHFLLPVIFHTLWEIHGIQKPIICLAFKRALNVLSPIVWSMHVVQFVDYLLVSFIPTEGRKTSMQHVIQATAGVLAQLIFLEEIIPYETAIIALCMHKARDFVYPLLEQVFIIQKDLMDRIQYWSKVVPGVDFVTGWSRYSDTIGASNDKPYPMKTYMDTFSEGVRFNARPMLPSLYANFPLRTVALLDHIVGTLIEGGEKCEKLLVRFLELYRPCFQYHDFPAGFVFDTLHYYHGAPLFKIPSVIKALLKVVSFTEDRQPNLYSAEMRAYIEDDGKSSASAFDGQYIHSHLYKIGSLLPTLDRTDITPLGLVLQAEKSQSVGAQDYYLGPQTMLECSTYLELSLKIALIEFMAVPHPPEYVTRAIYDVVRNGQESLKGAIKMSEVISAGLCLAMLPRVYRESLWTHLASDIIDYCREMAVVPKVFSENVDVSMYYQWGLALKMIPYPHMFVAKPGLGRLLVLGQVVFCAQPLESLLESIGGLIDAYRNHYESNTCASALSFMALGRLIVPQLHRLLASSAAVQQLGRFPNRPDNRPTPLCMEFMDAIVATAVKFMELLCFLLVDNGTASRRPMIFRDEDPLWGALVDLLWTIMSHPSTSTKMLTVLSQYEDKEYHSTLFRERVLNIARQMRE